MHIVQTVQRIDGNLMIDDTESEASDAVKVTMTV